MIVRQDSSLNSSYLRAAAASRFADRPFMITEYSHSFFNRYRHERGLYFGSYAALQGWDSLGAHINLANMLTPAPIGSFESPSDPISRAAEAVIALSWLRKDVKESNHLVELELSSKKLFPNSYLAAVGDEYAQLSMLTKIGIVYPEIKPFMPVAKTQADLSVIPERFSKLSVSRWFVSATTSYGNEFPQLVKKLRSKNILPKGNITAPSKRIYQSDTGQITLKGRQNTMTVSSPRLEGAIIKQNKAVKLKNLSIKSCSVRASVVVASLNKEQTLSDAGRILVIFSTNALNTDMIFENSRTMLDSVTVPVLIQTGKLSLTSKNKNKAFKAYALNIDGTRQEEVPVRVLTGTIVLIINTNKLKFCTPFFELVSTKK